MMHYHRHHRTVRAVTLLLGVWLSPIVVVPPAAGQNASAASATDAAASIRAGIEAGYARISEAFRRKDAPGVLALATPDFRVRIPGGRVLSRAQAQQNVQQNVDTIRSVQSDQYTIQKIAVRATSAVCDVTERSRVTFNDTRGEFGPIGKSHALAVTTIYRDTWVRSPDSSGGDATWRIKRSEMLSTRLLLDGRPYRPSRTRPRQQP